MSLDPGTIDVAKSRRVTSSEAAHPRRRRTNFRPPPHQRPRRWGQLDSAHKLPRSRLPLPRSGRNCSDMQQPSNGNRLGKRCQRPLRRAFENVGIFENKLRGVPVPTRSRRPTATTRTKVFNTLNATAFLWCKTREIAGVDRSIRVDLFLRNHHRRAAGRSTFTRRARGSAWDAEDDDAQAYSVESAVFNERRALRLSVCRLSVVGYRWSVYARYGRVAGDAQPRAVGALASRRWLGARPAPRLPRMFGVLLGGRRCGFGERRLDRRRPLHRKPRMR